MNNDIAEKAKSWDKLNKHFNGFLDLYINHYTTLTTARNNQAVVEKLKEFSESGCQVYDAITPKNDDVPVKKLHETLKEILKTIYHSIGSEGTS